MAFQWELPLASESRSLASAKTNHCSAQFATILKKRGVLEAVRKILQIIMK